MNFSTYKGFFARSKLHLFPLHFLASTPINWQLHNHHLANQITDTLRFETSLYIGTTVTL